MRTWKCPSVTTEASKPEFRIGHSATYDPTMRCIYIFGGSKNAKWFHDVYMFDLDENKWTLVKVGSVISVLENIYFINVVNIYFINIMRK